MNVTHLKRADIDRIDYYPFFIDYDFAEMKPRGGSAFIDFFACGRLCLLMDVIGDSGFVYVKKNKIAPCKGFFLADFSRIQQKPEPFIKALLNLNLGQVYLEDSRHYPIDGVINRLDDINIMLVSFVP